MKSLFVVLYMLVGSGPKQHWELAYLRHEEPTQAMLCEEHAERYRANATPGPHERLLIFCRKEPDEV